MKFLVTGILWLAVVSAEAQVILRNDFVIGKHQKIKGKGLSFITINLDRYPNLNQLINGRGGRSVVIDVQAVRKRKKSYSYTELAEKVYTPGPTYRPTFEPVPSFLLLEPPRMIVPAFSEESFHVGQPRLRTARMQ